MVVERVDDERKDLAWEDRLAADGYSCVALSALLSHTPGLYYLFILLCLSLSLSVSLSLSHGMEMAWFIYSCC